MRIALVFSLLLSLSTAVGLAASKAPPHPHTRPAGYALAGNSTKSTSSFISKTQAEVAARLYSDAQAVTSVLKRYSQFEADHRIGVTNLEVAPDRMVWEVTFVHATSFVNHAGTWAPNARVTIAYDAETGRVIGILTEGQRISEARRARGHRPQ